MRIITKIWIVIHLQFLNAEIGEQGVNLNHILGKWIITGIGDVLT